MRDLRRDLWLYLKALWKHWGTLLAGPTVTLVLLVSEEVFKIDIPRWVLGLAAVAGILVAGFLAWRDERRKVAPKEIDPEVELRRPQFEREIAKLTPEQEGVLAYVLGVGDAHAIRLRDNYFREQLGRSVSAHDADMLLTTIAETTLLEPKVRGVEYVPYQIKPVWGKLLVEWAAPPTAVDKWIVDKARALRRTLAASFEDWPTGLNKLDDLTTWAGRLAVGFPHTEAVLNDMVERRPEASRRVERGVARVQDEYYMAADVINRLFKGGGLSINADNRQAIEAELRKGEVHVRQCLAALDSVTRG